MSHAPSLAQTEVTESQHAPTNDSNTTSLRVLHLIHGFEMGGAEKLLLEFAAHVDRQSFELQFLALGHDGPIGNQLRAQGHNAVAFDRPSGLSLRLLMRVVRHLRRQRIDILHTHDDRAHIYGAAASLLVPLRLVVHTRHGQSPRLSPRQRWLVHTLSKRVDHFVCVSHNAAQLTVEQGIARQRVTTILNGIDLSRFSYQEPNATGPIVCVARLSPEKNIQNLIHAFALASKQVPHLHLELAGDGVCRKDLEQLVSQLKLTERVRFLGQVDDVPALLRRASLFVLPSKSEGIALTILEAQARGVPVIATAVGGTPEVVQDHVTGKLVPSDNSTRLADAIVELCNHAELRHRLSHNARANLEQQFDVRHMAKQYETLYRTALDSQPTRQ